MTQQTRSQAVFGAEAGPEIEFEHVSVTYGGPVPVHALRSASFRIDAGDMVAVAGRSGSGKSTLLNVLGLLDRPTSGRYLLRGVDTSLLSESGLTALRAYQFGFVFQSFHLLADRSAMENAELGLLYRGIPIRRRQAQAEQALRQVGLEHRLTAFPGTMSGGEKQRVAIARALAQRPRVLLCDEPTGNLDRSSAELIVNLLRDLNAQGLTILIVTHDDQVASRVPRWLHIDDGLVSEVPNEGAFQETRSMQDGHR